MTAPVTNVLSTFGDIAQRLVQVLYDLRPSIWSSESELDRKQNEVARLTNPDTWPFIYGPVQKVGIFCLLVIESNGKNTAT